MRQSKCLQCPTLHPPASLSTSPPTLLSSAAAPLIPGDDTSGYDTLLAGISATVQPGDLLEEAWVRDVADLIWEAVRLRRLKAARLTTHAPARAWSRLLESLGVG